MKLNLEKKDEINTIQEKSIEQNKDVDIDIDNNNKIEINKIKNINNKWNNFIKKDDPKSFYNINNKIDDDNDKYILDEPKNTFKRGRYNYNEKQFKKFKYDKKEYSKTEKNEINNNKEFPKIEKREEIQEIPEIPKEKNKPPVLPKKINPNSKWNSFI